MVDSKTKNQMFFRSLDFDLPQTDGHLDEGEVYSAVVALTTTVTFHECPFYYHYPGGPVGGVLVRRNEADRGRRRLTRRITPIV